MVLRCDLRDPTLDCGRRLAVRQIGRPAREKTNIGEGCTRAGAEQRPTPSLTTFDAPSREVCTIRRVRTNTPLQALVTLNDPVFIEAAQGLARRIVSKGGETLDSRLTYAFRLCISRPPTKQELDRLKDLYRDLRAAYGEDEQAAEQMSVEPIGPHDLPVDAPELATWTVISNVLLNLDELLAKI